VFFATTPLQTIGPMVAIYFVDVLMCAA